MPVVPWEGPPPPGAPDQLPNFTRLFLKVQCRLKLNVTTTRKGRQLLEGRKVSAPPEKIVTTLMRKGPPHYVGMTPNG